MAELYKYFIIFIVVLVAEVLYVPLAHKLRICSQPSHRSSQGHNTSRITGGGFIFYLAAGCFAVLFAPHTEQTFWWMFMASTMLAIVSFIDDIVDLSPSLRLFVQLVCMAFAYHYLLLYGYYDVFLVLVICGVGFVNAYNFMDGINGIMASYSLVTLGTLLYAFNSQGDAPVSYMELAVCLTISAVVFAVFNMRKQALVFAGDVGSIVMGFFIVFLMTGLIQLTHDASCVVFLLVYAVDTVYTIFQRLFIGENILLPHRRHLYQRMTNHWRWPHFLVATGYSAVQLIINIGYFLVPGTVKWSYVIVVLLLLSTGYFILKQYKPQRKR